MARPFSKASAAHSPTLRAHEYLMREKKPFFRTMIDHSIELNASSSGMMGGTDLPLANATPTDLEIVHEVFKVSAT